MFKLSLTLTAAASMTSAVILRKNRQDPEPWACYMNEAAEYTGTVSVANSGQKCMQWSDAAAHPDLGGNHFIGLTKGSKGGPKLEGNYCRAFPGDPKPWCFVKGYKSVPEAKQDCDVPQCPTDGPWSRDFKDESKDTIKCSDETGAPAVNCDCSCVGVKGNALIELANGDKRICHCPNN